MRDAYNEVVKDAKTLQTARTRSKAGIIERRKVQRSHKKLNMKIMQ